MKKNLIYLATLMAIVLGCSKKPPTAPEASPVIVSEGVSPSGHLRTRVTLSDMGGFRILRLYRSNSTEQVASFADATGFKWHPDKDILFYSSSPIYGTSGIFKVDATGNSISAKKIIGSLPDEWFELIEISRSSLTYRYVPNIEREDSSKAVTKNAKY